MPAVTKIREDETALKKERMLIGEIRHRFARQRAGLVAPRTTLRLVPRTSLRLVPPLVILGSRS
jgi:hypothetical protein